MTSWFAPDSRVHTTPEELKNARSFISMVSGLRSRGIGHKNTFLKQREFQTPVLSFRENGKHLITERDFPGRNFLKQYIKRPAIVAFLIPPVYCGGPGLSFRGVLSTKSIIRTRSSRRKNRRRSHAKENCTINKHPKQNQHLGVELLLNIFIIPL